MSLTPEQSERFSKLMAGMSDLFLALLTNRDSGTVTVQVSEGWIQPNGVSKNIRHKLT